MRITGLGAKHFLSFEDFEWSLPDDLHLNVIVGPNGAGKTNLFRVVRAVTDALDFNVCARWQRAARSGGDSFHVRLDVELTGEWERKLLRAFLHATLCDAQALQQFQSQHAQRAPVNVRPERWIEYTKHFLAADLS